MSSTDISDPGTLLYTYEGEDRGTKEIEFEVPSSGNWHIAPVRQGAMDKQRDSPKMYR